MNPNAQDPTPEEWRAGLVLDMIYKEYYERYSFGFTEKQVVVLVELAQGLGITKRDYLGALTKRGLNPKKIHDWTKVNFDRLWDPIKLLVREAEKG